METCQPEVLRSLAVAFRDQPWSWQTDDVEALCARMNWTLSPETDDMDGTADAGWHLAPTDVDLDFDDGRVNFLRLNVTGIGDGSGAAFAQITETLRAELGAPTGRGLSRLPSVRWRLPESTVEINHHERAVSIIWSLNECWDEQQAIGEALE